MSLCGRGYVIETRFGRQLIEHQLQGYISTEYKDAVTDFWELVSLKGKKEML